MLSGIACSFQDSIEGRRLAADGRARKRARAKKSLAALRALYVEMPVWKLLVYAESAGLITACERVDIQDLPEYAASLESRHA